MEGCQVSLPSGTDLLDGPAGGDLLAEAAATGEFVDEMIGEEEVFLIGEMGIGL